MALLKVEPEAEDDMREAFRWYENQRYGLGWEFLECIEDVFDRLRDMPEIHPPTYRNVRQALVRRFPYVVHYVIESDRVSVIGVFHGRRDPNAWKSRAP